MIEIKHLRKKSDENSTVTKLHRLNREERIRELAVLSSASVTESSLTAAEELLNSAQENN